MKTFDFDEALSPDVVGDVKEIASILTGKQFDAILCCQVLEHLPFENFEPILKQFASLAPNLILSLPQSCIVPRMTIKLPKIKQIHLALKIPFFWRQIRFEDTREHYWEMSAKGYPLSLIRKVIKKHYKIHKDYTVAENPYHHFFVLKR